MNWKDIIKRDWQPKKLPPKTKQINLHMKTRRLRGMLEKHPNIVVSGKYPTVYSYRGE